MRGILKEWKNGRHLPQVPGGKGWTVRIMWYEEGDGENIRLHLEDCEKVEQVYPANKQTADNIWKLFKEISPKEGERKPILSGFDGMLWKIQNSSLFECRPATNQPKPKKPKEVNQL